MVCGHVERMDDYLMARMALMFETTMRGKLDRSEEPRATGRCTLVAYHLDFREVILAWLLCSFGPPSHTLVAYHL